MADKITIMLKKPMPAVLDCLPHAAMNLGTGGGAGLRPVGRMVTRLVIERQFDNWVFYRLDEAGGFVADTWHGSREDALWQAKKEFGEGMEEES